MKVVQMTEGSVWKPILFFSLPMLLSNFFQQMYNTVDSIIVGKFVGDDALAAVGSSDPIVNLLVGFFIGLSTGASVLASQSFGGGNKEGVHKAVHTASAMTIIFGALITFVGVISTPWILRAMNTPDSVFGESSLYLKIFFAGIIAPMIYNMGAAILQAVGDSRTPFFILASASVTNIVLDLILVKYMNMGIAGAAWATVISQAASAVLVTIKLMRVNDSYRLRPRDIRLHVDTFKKILKIGLPGGFQSTAVSLSNVIVQGSINRFGSLVMAGCSAYFKIEGFALMPMFSFAIALTTFVGQNVGCGDFDRVKRGTKAGIIMSGGTTVIISLLLMLVTPTAMKLFTDDPQVIRYGVMIMWYSAAAYILLGISQSVAGALRGAGRTLVPMITMIVCWGVIRVLWNIIGLQIIDDVRIVFSCYPVTWFISAVFFCRYLKKHPITKDNVVM